MKSKAKIIVNPEYEALRSFVEELAASGMPADADIIYAKRNTLGVVERQGVMICVKAFRKPNFVNACVYGTLRKSKARRSYDNALALLASGFLTPAPVGMAEVYDSLGRLAQSYYACLYCDGQELRMAFEHPQAGKLFDDLAAEIARLHEQGILMRDFSGGNVLYRQLPGGEFAFYHVDLNRISFGVKSWRRLMGMFARVMWRTEDVAVLARKYAEQRGIDAQAAQFAAVRAFMALERNYKIKRKLRSIWKKSRP